MLRKWPAARKSLSSLWEVFKDVMGMLPGVHSVVCAVKQERTRTYIYMCVVCVCSSNTVESITNSGPEISLYSQLQILADWNKTLFYMRCADFFLLFCSSVLQTQSNVCWLIYEIEQGEDCLLGWMLYVTMKIKICVKNNALFVWQVYPVSSAVDKGDSAAGSACWC